MKLMLFGFPKWTVARTSKRSQVLWKYSVYGFGKLLFLILLEREGGGGGNYVFLTYSVIPLNEVVSISIHQIAVIVNYLPMVDNLF